jgi:hypothetical protein
MAKKKTEAEKVIDAAESMTDATPRQSSMTRNGILKILNAHLQKSGVPMRVNMSWVIMTAVFCWIKN